jgi:endonuclease-3
MQAQTWTEAFQPLLEQYGSRKHPLEYQNHYQLLVMVILSSRTTDAYINKLAKTFFPVFPDMRALANVTPEDLYPHIKSVPNFRHKSAWLTEIAQIVKTDENIPTTMADLERLPGIGRKSANVIIREMHGKAEGVIVDLHVVRVAPRIGVAAGANADKIEKQLMEAIPDSALWNQLGMGISFLGREVCRPKPKCSICIMNPVCQYYQQIKEGKMPEPAKKPMATPNEGD